MQGLTIFIGKKIEKSDLMKLEPNVQKKKKKNWQIYITHSSLSSSDF